MEVIHVAHCEPRLRNSWSAHSDLTARMIARVTTADSHMGVGETYDDDQVIAALEGLRGLVE